MAHELEIKNGEASMFYYGDAPWHGLGVKLNEPATSKEAIVAAKLDWQVKKSPIYLNDKKEIKNKFAIVRDDAEQDVFAIVGKDYTPLQNFEAFEFFDSIVGDNRAIYHTAGALFGGKVVWILAKLPGEIKIAEQDILHKYLLLSNSHDGTTAVKIKFTPVRVVCNNTLTLAFQDKNFQSVWHQRDIKNKLKGISKLFGALESGYNKIEGNFNKFINMKLNDTTLDKYLLSVFPNPNSSRNREQAAKQIIKSADNRNWSKFFYENGTGNNIQGVRNTLWTAYNGVVEYIDYKKGRQSVDGKVNSIWLGEGAAIKERAYKEAVALVT